MSVAFETLLALALAAGTVPTAGQVLLYYVEPGVVSCPPAPAQATAAPRLVSRGVAVRGRIRVVCGLDQGSYTITLNSTDPGATFSPRTFVVNFGRLVGKGDFAVTFSTVGSHSVSAAITSNMGSPGVKGYFASPTGEYKVVHP